MSSRPMMPSSPVIRPFRRAALSLIAAISTSSRCPRSSFQKFSWRMPTHCSPGENDFSLKAPVPTPASKSVVPAGTTSRWKSDIRYGTSALAVFMVTAMRLGPSARMSAIPSIRPLAPDFESSPR